MPEVAAEAFELCAAHGGVAEQCAEPVGIHCVDISFGKGTDAFGWGQLSTGWGSCRAVVRADVLTCVAAIQPASGMQVFRQIATVFDGEV